MGLEKKNISGCAICSPPASGQVRDGEMLEGGK